ncbi:MAG: hypothetical protein JXP34_07040 [Planctomycetes bacterium]|nr:hypothetical protein [Planctomycetota bacterium]
MQTRSGSARRRGPARHGPRGLAVLVLGTLSLAAFGCGGNGGRPALVSALLVQDEESPAALLLVFDRPLDPTLPDPAAEAIETRPPVPIRVASATRPRPSEIRLTLRSGEGLEPKGHFDPERPAAGPTGIALRADWLANAGAFVDLTLAPAFPRLIETRWKDANHDRVVDEGDWVELVFDRPVRLSDLGKTRGLDLVPDHVILAVEGDRLGDADKGERGGVRRSPLSEDQDACTIRILLGSAPRLQVAGTFQPERTQSGSPSGLAVNATPIEPSRIIVDGRWGSLGAISRGVSDLGFDPDFSPIVTACETFPHGGGLEFHSAVALQDRILIVGGADPVTNFAASPTAQILEFIPGNPLREIGRLHEVRRGHAALVLPSPADRGISVVLVIGGILPTGKTGTIEIIRPIEGAVTMAPISLKRPRSGHAAVAVPGAADADGVVRSGEIWVIGGEGGEGLISIAEVLPYRWENGSAIPTLQQPEFVPLQYARTEHTATLVTVRGRPMIFIFGGLCRATGDPYVVPVPWTHPTLLDPEAWRRAGAAAPDLERNLPDKDSLWYARRRHRAVWLEDSREVLIVGGTAQHPDRLPSPLARPDLALLWRADEPTRFDVAGFLSDPRTAHEVVPLPDGRVLVIGGEDMDGQPLSSIEVYLPWREGFFPFCAPLPAPRRSFAAARLEGRDGQRVYVIGGGEGPAVLEIDPGRTR